MLDLGENRVSLDKLANHTIISIEIGGLVESHEELGSIGVGSVVEKSENTPLEVSHVEVLIWESGIGDSKVLLVSSDDSSLDSVPWDSVGELSSHDGSSVLLSLAEGSEVEGECW